MISSPRPWYVWQHTVIPTLSFEKALNVLMSSDSLKKKKDHLYFILIMCFLSILVTINITESLCSIFVVILRTERYTTDLSNSSRVAVSFTDLLSLFIFHRVLKCNETRKIFGLHTAKNLI